VRFEHEGMEMDPALWLDRDMLEGEVHQHGLATADAAPKVDAPQAIVPIVEQLAEQSAVFGIELSRQPVERYDRPLLRGVGL
jgi:hypothetical protein